MSLLEYLDADDLSDDAQILSDIIGIDKMIEVIEQVGGSSIYIPFSRKFKNERIIKKMLLANPNICMKKLARKYHISQSHLRKIYNNLIASDKSFRRAINGEELFKKD